LPEVICNTPPLQYLHQLDLLDVLQALTDHIIVPPAVVHELAASRAHGVSLPDPTRQGGGYAPVYPWSDGVWSNNVHPFSKGYRPSITRSSPCVSS